MCVGGFGALQQAQAFVSFSVEILDRAGQGRTGRGRESIFTWLYLVVSTEAAITTAHLPQSVDLFLLRSFCAYRAV